MPRVMISLPEKILNNVDKIADELEISRSALIREAVQFYEANQELISSKGYKLT